MKNNFINNNGATLQQNKNSKKTQVENRIDALKQQEREITTKLSSWEIKVEKIERLTNYLNEVERFGTEFLATVVVLEKEQENRNDYRLEILIENKVEFVFKFRTGNETFTKLVSQNVASQVSYLKSQLRDIQSQLRHQERLFARIEIRRQGKTLLECKLNNSIGCLGVWQCANCQTNYLSNNSQQFQEVATP